MGRGQEWDMEKSDVDAYRKDLRSMNQRRSVLLVTFSVLLVPFLITSSYIYYNITPDASTEAMRFFQRQPSSLTPLKVEPKMGDTKNTTNDSRGAKPVEGITEVDAMAENESRGAKPVEGITEVDAVAENESRGAKPVEGITEADAVAENESRGAKPVEGNTEADAMAENEREKVNSTSRDVNATTVDSDALKQSKVPDHIKSEPSVIVMESHDKGVCDLVKGSWVPDPRPPQYTNATCRHIEGHQNCIKNGRPDTEYLHWRWQPEQCELSRIDAAAFLSAMRDRSMCFVGDSLARNQFQSLLCLLSQAEEPDHVYQRADDKDNIHVFRSHNFTLAIYWSPRLVHVEDKVITWPDNSTVDVAHIHLDKLDKALVERLPGVDIVQISTGQWWFKRSMFYLGGQPIGVHWYDPNGHACEEWKECTKTIGFADPFRIAIHNVLQGTLSTPAYTGTTVFRTFSPDHFEDGRWDTGGKCVRTTPGGVPMSEITKVMHEIQIQEFQNVTGALSAAEKKRIRLLDITDLAQVRADGHPDAYRNFQPFSKESILPVQKDCLHWCIPGPIDTWNELLVETLRR